MAIDNPSDYLIHDVLFHRTVAQASGNPILAAIMETITSSLYDQRRKTVGRAIDLSEAAEMHRKIYLTVRVRKPSEAKMLMQRHLRIAHSAQGMERPIDRKAHLRSTKIWQGHDHRQERSFIGGGK